MRVRPDACTTPHIQAATIARVWPGGFETVRLAGLVVPAGAQSRDEDLFYGLTAYAVTRRTHEIAIRAALGAERVDVVRMVLRHGMSLTIIGAVIGVVLAAGVSRLWGAWLRGVPPLDPATFVTAAALCVVIGLAACYVPARRAARVEPMVALRCD